MSYDHMRVDVIEKATKALLTRLEGEISTVNADDPPVPMVDGIPVIAPLFNFCAEIRKVNRHVKFGVGKRVKNNWGHSGPNRVLELYVYMDGHTYAMMKIGYADYSIRLSDGSKYMVSARMIKNEKFSEDKDQYHMATAESIERAVKNVKKYMRPYAPIECASMSFESVRSKFSSVVQGVSSELYNAKNDILSSSHLRMELFHMLDVGYEFLSEEFRERIVLWRTKYQEDQEARGRALHAYYVNVRIHREEMVCDVIEVLDANKRHRLEPHMAVTTYKMEELPEGVAGNLAALSMVEDDHYVDGVGLRVDSSTFWVQR
jgi:hypothetical protein